MPSARNRRDLVLAVSPCGAPNPRLAAAVVRAGGTGILDLGRAGVAARRALELAAQWSPGRFGVRAGRGCALDPAEVERLAPGRVDCVVLGAGSPWHADDPRLAGYRVLCEVTSLAEARAAAGAGADGLIARGGEAGGAVGELSTLVLLQQLASDADLGLPIWAAGGIGEHTAAAAVIGGATGVVLDIQLALLAESELPEHVSSALSGMDGSETVCVGGHRVLRPRGAAVDAFDSARTPQQAADLLGTDPGALLPIGQDGFLAARFRDRYANAGAAVRAIRSAIIEAVRDEAAAHLLGAGAPLAHALGTPLPVAQGPMTRVSDQSAFAASVAEHGALPFLALALSDADQTRTMMQQAAAVLGDRPWGVGVLGFAPESTRTAQLEIIKELRPSCAIVAGGRPAQARTLEDAGVSTFLHVPSPGLLRQFLDAGARKFVFEGSECGGHTGPRASFPLWEAQLGILEDWLGEREAKAPTDEAAQACEVLFAGGVHDARSAAMVAAMARPLAVRGVRIGVLMGTAYLFTEEAVRSGAIQPLFQQQVVGAEATALLETAPGHTTRGVVSPFTDEFERIKEQLRADGISGRDAWERLEAVNV